MSYLDHPHVQQWLADHWHRILPQEVAAEVHERLLSLPWLPSRVDWREVPHQTVEIGSDWDGAVDQVLQTAFGRHTHILALYTPDEPALLCRLEDGIRDSDLLYSSAPGIRYMCAASIADEVPRPDPLEFIEVDLDRFTIHTKGTINS